MNSDYWKWKKKEAKWTRCMKCQWERPDSQMRSGANECLDRTWCEMYLRPLFAAQTAVSRSMEAASSSSPTTYSTQHRSFARLASDLKGK
jgi:hypothetical protein